MGLSVPPERGWEEAHAAGVATGQDGGADKGAVLLPGPSPCLQAALPPLKPLPQNATKAVLPPLRAPGAAWIPSWAPIPAHPCSQAPPALWDWGGHLQQLLLFPGLLQVRGASLTPWSVTGCRVMPPTPAHCRAPPRSVWGLGLPPLCTSVTNPTIPSEEQSSGQVVAALREGAGDNTYTSPAGEARSDAHAETEGVGRGRCIPVAPGCR